MRIGLFGGTFDPIHNGHLRAALDVAEAMTLKRCILIPAATPPHKTGKKIPNVNHRLAMTQTAVEGVDALSVSNVEARRSGPSFTIDTVRHFQRTLAAETELFLLIGADAFFEIDAWHAWRELLEAIAMVVMTRPGEGAADFAVSLSAFIEAHVPGDYRFESARRAFFHPGRPPIHYVPVTMLDISSTDIRSRIRRGRSIRYLVPETVERYIREKELYR